MALSSLSIRIEQDEAGAINSRRPDPGATVVWATVPSFDNQPQSTAFSEDIRAGYLSGSGAATAVITIVDVSGDTAATLGLTIAASDNLDTAAGTVGSGTFRLKATHESVEYFSNQFSFSVVATGTDTLAPSVPLPESVVAVSATQIDISILPSSDPKIPAEPASGMDTIEIWRAVGAGSFSLLTTKDIDAGLSVQLVANTIGTHGVSPTATQQANGFDWSCTAEGVNGIDDPRPTAGEDEILFVSAPVSNLVRVTAKIPSYTVPTNGKAAAQLMVRQTLGETSRFISCGRLGNVSHAPDPKVSEVKWRSETGGSINFLNPHSNLSGDRWFRIEKSGDVYTCYLWNESDQTWTQLAQQTILMSSLVEVGFFINSGLADTTATALFQNVCIQSLPLVTHSDTGLTESTLYTYKFKGVSL